MPCTYLDVCPATPTVQLPLLPTLQLPNCLMRLMTRPALRAERVKKRKEADPDAKGRHIFDARLEVPLLPKNKTQQHCCPASIQHQQNQRNNNTSSKRCVIGHQPICCNDHTFPVLFCPAAGSISCGRVGGGGRAAAGCC